MQPTGHYHVSYEFMADNQIDVQICRKISNYLTTFYRFVKIHAPCVTSALFKHGIFNFKTCYAKNCLYNHDSFSLKQIGIAWNLSDLFFKQPKNLSKIRAYYHLYFTITATPAIQALVILLCLLTQTDKRSWFRAILLLRG